MGFCHGLLSADCCAALQLNDGGGGEPEAVPAPLELRFPDSRGLVARHAWLSDGRLLVGFSTGEQRLSAAPHVRIVSMLMGLQCCHGIASRSSIVCTLLVLEACCQQCKTRSISIKQTNEYCAVCEGMVALVAAVGDSAGAELYAQSHLKAGMADMALAPDQSCAGALETLQNMRQKHAAQEAGMYDCGMWHSHASQ